jgi:hypothetical protein
MKKALASGDAKLKEDRAPGKEQAAGCQENAINHRISFHKAFNRPAGQIRAYLRRDKDAKRNPPAR